MVANAVGKTGGSVSWRTNNPGNIVYGAFAKAQGAIGSMTASGHSFAIFPTEQAGWAALLALLRSPTYQALTLAGVINRYAPPSANNTAAYTAFVTRKLGLSSSTPMRSLSPAQLTSLAEAIKQHEGWQVGTSTTDPLATTISASPPVRQWTGESIERLPPFELADFDDPLEALRIDGITNPADAVLSARVSMSTTQVSQITLRLVGTHDLASAFQIGTSRVALGTWLFRVSAIEVGPGAGSSPEITIEARSELAQNLRHDPYDKAWVGQNMSPAQALATVCKYVVAESSDPWPQIDVKAADTGPDQLDTHARDETWWDASARWARIQGCWRFEAENTLFYGRPSWLAEKSPSLELAWQGKPDNVLMAHPSVRSTEDGDDPTVITTTVTLQIHPRTAVKLRPGMTVQLSGLGYGSGIYIITDAEGDVRRPEPWQVNATTIKDPTPQAETTTSDETSLPDAPGSTGVTPTSGPPKTTPALGDSTGIGTNKTGTIKTPNGTIESAVVSIDGAKWTVAAQYAPRFQGFLIDAKAQDLLPGQKFISAGGYNLRKIKRADGTFSPNWSRHAYGEAIDLNNKTNGQGGKSTSMNTAVARALAAKWGLTWGGDWSGSTYDPMHFEVKR